MTGNHEKVVGVGGEKRRVREEIGGTKERSGEHPFKNYFGVLYALLFLYWDDSPVLLLLHTQDHTCQCREQMAHLWRFEGELRCGEVDQFWVSENRMTPSRIPFIHHRYNRYCTITCKGAL